MLGRIVKNTYQPNDGFFMVIDVLEETGPLVFLLQSIEFGHKIYLSEDEVVFIA